MKKRPLIFSYPEKRRYDVGTPNEQIITLQRRETHFEVILTKVFCWLSEHMWVSEPPAKMEKVPGTDNRYRYASHYSRFAGTGFYMSGPWAHRVYWVWRGRARWTMFWGPRVEPADKIIEIWKYK